MRTDLAQYYNSTNPSNRLTYITSAEEKVNFNINGTELLMRDLNIFCSTSANHRSILEQLKQMAMTNNTAGASIYDLGKIVQSDSIAELNSVLKSSQAKQEAQKQQEMQQQQQMQQEQLASQEKQKQMVIQSEAENQDKQLQNNITVAEIRAAGYGAAVDVNENELSDYQDAMKDIRDTEQYQDQTNLQRDKDSNRMTIDREKNNIEREKIQAQKEIAEKQLQIAMVNKNKFDKNNKK
jgi:hypothetical protein